MTTESIISPSIRYAALVVALEHLFEKSCAHPPAESLREERRGELVCSECGAPFRLRTTGPKS